jgi:hypothetical protein
MVVPLASLLLASGCAGNGGEEADDAQPTDARPNVPPAKDVARNLATAVRDMDGGTLKDIGCEPRPTELENSTQWECRCMRRDPGGTSFFPALYSAQARSDGELNGFVLKSPR